MQTIKKEHLPQLFPGMVLPIGNGQGIYWNGRPGKWSNIPQYKLDFTQRFGQNLMNYKQFGLVGHNGIDIRGEFRTPIVAPYRMFVTTVNDSDRNRGLSVRSETETVNINGEHVKLGFIFGHFDEIVAKPYHWMEKGQLVGFMDNTGYSSGNHVHFEIRPWWSENKNTWYLLDGNNGYAGSIDPEPFLPHIVWNWAELNNITITNMEQEKIDKFMIDNDLKLIRNANTGAFGWIYARKLRVADTTDRTVLMLAQILHRKDGSIQINDDFWQQLPKEQF